MSIEFSGIMPALSALKGWFATGRRPDAGYQEALEALYTALNETRIYIGLLDRSKFGLDQGEDLTAPRRSIETEARLSQLWTHASLKLRQVDRDLAERCFDKGDYWAHPDEWTEDDVKRARIQIDSVFRAARRLL